MIYLSYKLRPYRLARLFALPLVFAINIILSPQYTSGDQEYYRDVYEGIAQLSLFDGYLYYTSQIQSNEFIHYLFSWVGSHLGIGKDLFYAFISSILVHFFLKVCEKYDVSVWISLCIVFTNFYFFVLYFSAERLKVSFVFLLVSIAISHRRKFSLVSATLSVLAHAQTAALYFSIIFAKFVSPITEGKLSRSSLYMLLGVPAVFIALGDHISIKFAFYSAQASDRGAIELLRVILFLGMGMYYSDTKKQVFALFMPLIVLIALIGGDRINMIAYFVFLYFGLRYNRGINLGVLVTSIYFAFQTMPFIYNIITQANGFADS
jgi:hypothetical protein